MSERPRRDWWRSDARRIRRHSQLLANQMDMVLSRRTDPSERMRTFIFQATALDILKTMRRCEKRYAKRYERMP